MKLITTILFLCFLVLANPLATKAQESYQISDNLSFQILDNGDWQVRVYGTDYLFHWLTPDLMRVEGSDNSCWYVYESAIGETITSDCSLVSLSKLLYKI